MSEDSEKIEKPKMVRSFGWGKGGSVHRKAWRKNQGLPEIPC